MGLLKRTLSFGKDKKSTPSEPMAAGSANAQPTQPSGSTGRRITRSLSFSGRTKAPAMETDAPGARSTANPRASAGDAIASAAQPSPSSKSMKRSNSFGRKAKSSAAALPEPEPEQSEQERREQKVHKQAIAASECAPARHPIRCPVDAQG